MRILTMLAGAALLSWALVTPAAAEIIRLEAEDYKDGGQGVGFNDNDPDTNNGGQYRTAAGDGVDIEAASEGGFNVGWTGGGEWFYMTTDTTPGPWVNDPVFTTGGNYKLEARVASDPGGNHRFKIEVGGPGGAIQPIVTGPTGGWQTWASVNTVIGPIPAGAQTVRLLADTDGFNINWIELTPTADPLPSLVAPPGPSGGAGYMGVREVIDNGGIGDQDAAYTSLASGTGTIVDYTASVLNIQDSGGGGNFGNDDTYGVVTAGLVAKESVDNISLVAKGTLRIPEGQGGDWTFGVNSDDGFTLQIPGHDFTSISGGGEIRQLSNGNALQFWGGRGTADTLGVINLPAGDYPFWLTHHEGGGGAAVEFFAAPGAQTSFNSDLFRLVGDTTLIPERVYRQVAQLTSDARVINGASIGDISAPDAIARTRDSVNAALADWANAAKGVADTLVIPEGDMPNGGGDNYTTGIFGEFAVLDTDGQPGEVMTFALRTDDGSQLRIIGQDFTAVSSASGQGTLVDVNGDMALTAEFPTGDANTFGLITLNEGVYAFEALHYEGGGGSQVEIYAVAGDWLAGFPRGLMPLTTDTLSPVIIPGSQGLELVPEPSSLVLAGLGMLSLIGLIRRRNG